MKGLGKEARTARRSQESKGLGGVGSEWTAERAEDTKNLSF